jgi:hypothetical protein
MEHGTPRTTVDVSSAGCVLGALAAVQHAHAPLGAPSALDVYDNLDVSSSTSEENDPLAGRVRRQRYVIRFSHTPFPNHRLLMTWVNGTTLLYSHISSALKPGMDNLGAAHSADVTRELHVSIVQELETDPPATRIEGDVPGASGGGRFPSDSVVVGF